MQIITGTHYDIQPSGLRYPHETIGTASNTSICRVHQCLPAMNGDRCELLNRQLLVIVNAVVKAPKRILDELLLHSRVDFAMHDLRRIIWLMAAPPARTIIEDMFMH